LTRRNAIVAGVVIVIVIVIVALRDNPYEAAPFPLHYHERDGVLPPMEGQVGAHG
jgi:hypothetical protein